MRSFSPDLFIAIGGGSPMDAAKVPSHFYPLFPALLALLATPSASLLHRQYSLPFLLLESLEPPPFSLVALPHSLAFLSWWKGGGGERSFPAYIPYR